MDEAGWVARLQLDCPDKPLALQCVPASNMHAHITHAPPIPPHHALSGPKASVAHIAVDQKPGLSIILFRNK